MTLLVLGWVFAAESPSIPVEITALAALVGIVWWMVKRADQNDTQRDNELAQTRKELVEVRRDLVEQLKDHADELRLVEANHAQRLAVEADIRHGLVNALSAARGGLALIIQAAGECTCDATSLRAAAQYAQQVLANRPLTEPGEGRPPMPGAGDANRST